MGCAVSGGTATLTYSNCNFTRANATWSGSQAVAFTGATPVCGSAFPTAQSQVVRTFPSLTTRISSGGTTVQIDTQAALTYPGVGTNYLGATIQGGYTVGWTGGKPSSITINGVNLKSSGTATWLPLLELPALLFSSLVLQLTPLGALSVFPSLRKAFAPLCLPRNSSRFELTRKS